MIILHCRIQRLLRKLTVIFHDDFMTIMVKSLQVTTSEIVVEHFTQQDTYISLVKDMKCCEAWNVLWNGVRMQCIESGYSFCKRSAWRTSLDLHIVFHWNENLYEIRRLTIRSQAKSEKDSPVLRRWKITRTSFLATWESATK